MLYKIAMLMAAGGLGTTCRYFIAQYTESYNGTGYPFGTLIVNLLGCFLAGFFWAYLGNYFHLNPEMKSIVFIGFLGGFTTFSALILETHTMFEGSGIALAAMHILVQNVVGITALVIGLKAGKFL